MVHPITPDEALIESKTLIPDEVITAFNKCILQNLSNNCVASFAQHEVISIARDLMELADDEVFDCRWLNVEHIYEEVGWKVEYDRPGYNESYEANFTFRKVSK